MKSVLGEVVAHALDDAVAQQQVALHRRPAQVEIAILSRSSSFGRSCRLAFGETGGVRILLSSLNSVTRSSISPVASFGLAMPVGRCRDVARHLDHVLVAERLALVDQRRWCSGGLNTTCVMP